MQAFTDAASFHLGATSYYMGLSLTTALEGGGTLNYGQYLIGVPNIDVSGDIYGNTPRNAVSIPSGYNFVKNIGTGMPSDETPLADYLINHLNSVPENNYGVPFQSDPFLQFASNSVVAISDAGYFGFQLSTFGTDAPGSWSSLAFNVWSAPSFDSGVPGTSLSFGSLDGFGGLDAGTFDIPVFNVAPALDLSFNTSFGNLPSFNLANSSAFDSYTRPAPGTSTSFDSLNSPDNISIHAEVSFDLGPIIEIGLAIIGALFGFGFPVVLDLTGDGIKITPLSESNNYFDMAGDHFQHRTAWVAAGNGILVFDFDGDGQITQSKEIVFTEWDPTATNDMQALQDIFDTNYNGQLDSGDAQFANFKMLVTNLDGTTALQTLAQAGVQSINLIPDASNIVLPDGSVIQGQTTYTKVGGGTGTAAAVALKYEAEGKAITRTVVQNPDGSTTITNVARNSDGTLAETTTSTTSANGLSRTLSYDYDSDGVIDKTQSIVTVNNGNGSTTETLQNQTGANVLIDQTVTTTSADLKSITILRDANGDSLNDQTETRTTNVDNSRTIVVSDLNGDGSLIRKVTSTTSIDGLTRTAATDADGNGTTDVTNINSTVVNAGVRTQTVTHSSNNGALSDKIVTVTSADGSSKTIQIDNNGDSTYDAMTISSIVTNIDGSKTTTVTNKNGAGTITIGQVVTTLSADGSTKTTETDINGDGTFDVTVNDYTYTGAGDVTHTVETRNADGSLKSSTYDYRAADGLGRGTSWDVTGDGLDDHSDTVYVNADGSTMEQIFDWNQDGSYKQRSYVDTSADGLTVHKTVLFGTDNIWDIVDDTVTAKNADGSSTATVTNTNYNGSLRNKAVTNTSANGLSKTTEVDSNGDATFEYTQTDLTVVNPDGSLVETITGRNANNSLHDLTTISRSADRKTLSTTTDANGDGANDVVETVVTQLNGTVVDTVTRYNPSGTTLDKSVTTTSANGLSTTTQVDQNGDAVFDLTNTDTIVLNTDGSQVETVIETNSNGSLRDKSVLTTSATGLNSTLQTDSNGDATFELVTTSAKVFNADGSSTTTVTDTNANASVRDRIITTVSATGLTTTTQADLDGNGTTDRIHIDSTSIIANGSQVHTVTDQNGNGSLRAQVITTTSANGLTVNATEDSNGDGFLDRTEAISTAANGNVTDAVTYLNSNGTTRSVETSVTSADGLTVTKTRDLNGDGVADKTVSSATVLNSNGTRTTTESVFAGTALTSRSVSTTSADGRSITTMSDFDGNGVIDLTKTDMSVVNNDGSQTQTVTNTNANGLMRDQTVTTTSSDQKTVHVQSQSLGFGVVDTDELRTIQADGSTLVSITYPNTVNSTDVNTSLISANGLSKSVRLNSPGFDYSNFDATTTLNSDGSQTTAFVSNIADEFDVTTTVSANGLSTTTTIQGVGNEGDPSLVLTSTDATTLNADGSRTQTIIDNLTQVTANSTSAADKLVLTTSGNGLSTTSQLDIDNNGTYDRTQTVAVAVDGSKTDTLTFYNPVGGALRQKDVLTTSIDGRTESLQRDSNGDAVFDHLETSAINADGSLTNTIWNTTAAGVMTDKRVTTTAANGLSKTIQFDSDGDGVFDYVQSTTTTLNADGSQLTVLANSFGNGVLRDKTTITTSANGLSKTTLFDMNGDGVADETETDVAVYNADGSTTSTKTVLYADSTLKERSVSTTTFNQFGSDTTRNVDSNGDGVDDRIVFVGSRNGNVSEYIGYYNPYVKNVASDTDPNGSTTRIQVYEAYTGQLDSLTEVSELPNANGSTSWHQYGGGYNKSATHTIDSAGVDTWVWNNQTTAEYAVNPIYHTVRIDLATEQRLTDVAKRLYDTILDREMMKSEVELLAAYISNGSLNATTLANDLLASAEYTTKYGTLSNAQFVELTYRNAVGRAASIAEVSSVLAPLATGTLTRAAFLNSIAENAEHIAIGNVHVASSSTGSGLLIFGLDRTMDKQVAGDIVRRMFDAALSRQATAAEVTTYSQKILSGSETEGQVANEILNLPEFTSKYGALTSTTYVTQIFMNALHRAPTSSELTSWVASLDTARITRADFLDVASQSTEHMAIQVFAGGSTNDTFFSGNLAETFDGGDGTNTLDFSQLAVAGVTANLSTGVATKANGAIDRMWNISNLVGSSGNDTLIGDAGSNTIQGGAGNDTLDGGTGNDTASYLSATAGVTVSLAVAAAQNTIGAGTDTLTGFENITGSAFNDTLTGDGNANWITGGGGNDIMNGGAGSDTASYANADSGVSVSLALTTAQNTVGAGTDTLSAFENLVGSAFNDTLTGDGNANYIAGLAGNDVMNGGAGVDTVSYNEGVTAGVTVSLALTTAQNTIGAGTDTLVAFENLNGSGFNDTLTGDSLANVIDGSAGNDVMNGGAGIDTVSYASSTAGVTVLLSLTTAQNTVGAGTDTLAAFENLTGSSYNDTLSGSAGANVLTGGAGVDTLSYSNATAAVTVSLATAAAQNTVGAGSDTISGFEKSYWQCVRRYSNWQCQRQRDYWCWW